MAGHPASGLRWPDATLRPVSILRPDRSPMPPPLVPSRAAEHLLLLALALADGRHLANTSDCGVCRLVYSTWACYPGLLREGEVAVTARPYVALDGLPPRSHLLLTPHDPHEDGVVFVQLEEVCWEDGRRDLPVLIGRERGRVSAARGRGSLFGGCPELQGLVRVRRSARELYTEPAGVVPEPDEVRWMSTARPARTPS